MRGQEVFIGKQYPVDTGAISFSVNNSTANQFRVVASLDNKLDIEILQKAVDATMLRYPMYNVVYSNGKGCVRNVTTVNNRILIQPYDIHFKKIVLDDDSPKLKVMYKANSIAVEMYHTLTDGNGCLNFLNTLIACYYHMQGRVVDLTGIIPYDSAVNTDEFVDGYEIFSKKGTQQLETVAMTRPFTVQGKHLDPDTEGNFLRITLSSSEVKDIKNKHNISIHELLVTMIYLTYLQFKNRSKSRKPIRIQMAINLRARFKTTTLRNFVGSIQFSTNKTTFDSIATDFNKFMLLATSQEELTSFLYKGYVLIKKVLPLLPRPIGRLSVNIGANIMGEKSYSTNLSNLGLVQNNLPGIVGYDFMISPPHHAPFCITSCAYGDECRILFSKAIDNDDFENEFLQQLKAVGLTPLRIEKLT